MHSATRDAYKLRGLRCLTVPLIIFISYYGQAFIFANIRDTARPFRVCSICKYGCVFRYVGVSILHYRNTVVVSTDHSMTPNPIHTQTHTAQLQWLTQIFMARTKVEPYSNLPIIH